MAFTIPKRIVWAADILNVDPSDSILEIGCGNGAAVSLVCERLAGGTITAIDRSEKMVQLAQERNRENIGSGKAFIKLAELLDSGLESASFSKIFLFNLNVFWMDPVAELSEIHRLLAHEGKFFIFHNPPPGANLKEYAEAISKNLEKNRFTIEEVIYDEDVFSLCIKSRPA